MTEVSKNQSFFKKLLDARKSWDTFQAPMYNRLIEYAAEEIYTQMIEQFDIPDNTFGIDVGSGPGFSTMMVAKRYPTISITGVDYSMTMVKAANENKAKRKVENCRFTLGDAMDLPFKDDTFDMAMSVASIKHWPDGARGLSEIKRVVKPGGRAVVGEALKGTPKKDLRRFSDKFAENFGFPPLMRFFVNRVVFGMSYTCEEAEKMAIQAGFKNVKVEKIPDWPFLMLTLIA